MASFIIFNGLSPLKLVLIFHSFLSSFGKAALGLDEDKSQQDSRQEEIPLTVEMEAVRSKPVSTTLA